MRSPTRRSRSRSSTSTRTAASPTTRCGRLGPPGMTILLRRKPAPGSARRAGQETQRPPPPEVAAIDLNNDGDLSAQEISQSSASLLKLDRDKDGKLSDEEVRPEAPPDGPPPAEGVAAPSNAEPPRAKPTERLHPTISARWS